jgi:hypothetical protein
MADGEDLAGIGKERTTRKISTVDVRNAGTLKDT